jgi:hypothetical protein
MMRSIRPIATAAQVILMIVGWVAWGMTCGFVGGGLLAYAITVASAIQTRGPVPADLLSAVAFGGQMFVAGLAGLVLGGLCGFTLGVLWIVHRFRPWTALMWAGVLLGISASLAYWVRQLGFHVPGGELVPIQALSVVLAGTLGSILAGAIAWLRCVIRNRVDDRVARRKSL